MKKVQQQQQQPLSNNFILHACMRMHAHKRENGWIVEIQNRML